MRKITLGRLPNNDIVFTPMSVSRMHADLICNNGSYQLIDHSAAGTTVNGYPVHNSSMTVNKGDNILLAGQVPLDWSRVEQIEYGGAGGTQVVQWSVRSSSAAIERNGYCRFRTVVPHPAVGTDLLDYRFE